MHRRACRRMPALVMSLALVCAFGTAVAQEGPRSGQGSGVPWVTRAVQAQGVRHGVFDSAAAGTRVSYHVYLPPGYEAEEGRRFPVLYWLHGQKGGLPGIAPLSRFFGAAMRDGRMPRMIIVFPNGRSGSMWCDSKDGRVPMETVVIRELVPHIDRTFRTVAERSGRIIEGFSMGGYGAARLGFVHSGLFCAVSLLGAGPLQRVLSQDIGPAYKAGDRRRILASVYGGDQEYFKALSPWVLAEQRREALQEGMLIRMAVGGLDGTLGFHRDFHEHLERLGIPHSFSVAPGVKHDAILLLESLGGENGAFYRAALSSAAANSRGTTRLLAVGKPTAANPEVQQERAVTAVRKVAAAARSFQPGMVVRELAENVLTKRQVRRGRAQLRVTRAIFRNLLRELAQECSPRDTVFLYTHTHGRKAGFEPAQPLGGMVLDLPVLEPEHRGTLLWDEYVDLLLRIPAKNVVVLTMACFSGGLVEYLDAPAVRKRWKDRRKEGRNLIVLSSQNADLPSPPIVKDREVVNPFTYAVARAMAGEADGFRTANRTPAHKGEKDGKITARELVDCILHLTENTPSDFEGRKNIAKPRVTGSFDPDTVLLGKE